MPKLQINLDEVADAMEQHFMEVHNAFLNTATGEVSMSAPDRLGDFAPDIPEHHLRLPLVDSGPEYGDMVAFIATLNDQACQSRLTRAIEGRGAFRRFKEALEDDRRIRERWFAFLHGLRRERAREWLEEQGVDAEYTSWQPVAPDPSEPTPRQRLIAETLHFVQAARQLPGVTRIALIGSLTTDEPDPNDTDLLVTVTDEADLEPLAALGRKLAGHAQTFNRGGEVFLADPRNTYLGRTCHWKRCEPFARLRCAAQHCGRRHYLYDDLQNLRLAKHLIAKPPLVLWPQIVAHGPMPADIQTGLLNLLTDGANNDHTNT